MNKKIQIGIVCGLIVCLMLVAAIFQYFGKSGVVVIPYKSLENIHYPSSSGRYDESKVYKIAGDKLITYQYSNGAWDFVLYGELITTTGERYEYNCGNPDIRDITECITKQKESISQDDLEKILSMENKIKPHSKTNNIAMDFGEVSIRYYGEDEYILDAYGDVEMINHSSGAREVLRILRKYNIYIY